MNKEKLQAIKDAHAKTNESARGWQANDAIADLSRLSPVPFLLDRVHHLEALLRDVQSAQHIADILALRPHIAEYLDT